MTNTHLILLPLESQSAVIQRYYANNEWGGLTLDGHCAHALGHEVTIRVSVAKPKAEFLLAGKIGWIRRQSTPKLGIGYGVDMTDTTSSTWERLLAFARNELGPEAVRQVIRVPVELPVEVRVAGQAVHETITDLSPRGAFVQTSRAWAVGTLLDLTVRPPRSVSSVPVRAEVRWRGTAHGHQGVGVKFVDVHVAVGAAMHSLTQKYAR